MSNAAVPSGSSRHERPRVVFLGMRCAFSVPPLQALVASDCDLRAVVLPALPGSPQVRIRPPDRGRRAGLPAAGHRTTLPTVTSLAQEAGLPVVEIGDMRSPEVVSALEELDPDVIAVACFPWLIPARVRALPRLGCLNTHPSLLPRWRGPEPIFWTFKAGDRETGATIHLMDGGFDSGPVLRQEPVAIPSGIDGLSLERQLATVGGRLLVEAIAGLASGALVPQPQNLSLATCAPVPNDDDLIVDPAQPAQRVFDLIRGISPLWGPLTLKIADSRDEFVIDDAIGFDPTGTQAGPVARTENTLSVRCHPGVVKVTLRQINNDNPLTPRVSV